MWVFVVFSFISENFNFIFFVQIPDSIIFNTMRFLENDVNSKKLMVMVKKKKKACNIHLQFNSVDFDESICQMHKYKKDYNWDMLWDSPIWYWILKYFWNHSVFARKMVRMFCFDCEMNLQPVR